MKTAPFIVLLFLGLSRSSSVFELEGVVAAEHYNYYKIFHPGNLLLVLDTLDGDADIYVSEKTPTPTFHPDTYDFQSSTCGTDSIYISKSLKRPVAAGVYGHFSYNESRYALGVFTMPETIDHFEEDFESYNRAQDSAGKEKKGASKAKRKMKNIPNSLWPFLELFEILFL